MKLLLELLIVIAVLIMLASGEAHAATLYVDPAQSSAQDAGEGSKNQPYQTLSYAMKHLRPGDTLNIAPGIYRDALVFPERAWSFQPTVIQPAAKGEVLIKGSDVVAEWEPVGPGLYAKRPWKVNSEQVFVDGAALKQIGGTILNGYPERPGHLMGKLHTAQGGVWPERIAGGVREMTENSFYFDESGESLYIKVPFDSLEGHVVEASVRPYLVLGKGLKNIIMRNLHFQHANTTAVSQSGAISMFGNRLLLDRIEVTHVDGSGFDIQGDENIIKNSRANYCGQIGMKVRGRANRLLGNETNFNNTRGFNKWWEAGGAKFVGYGGLRDSEVSGNRAVGNDGDGFWFDWMNSNNRIHGNVAAYNNGFGIHYEASQKGYIYDNYVFGNKQRGIYLPHSSDSTIEHNLVAMNGMEGIAIIDEGRSKEKEELRPRANRVLFNIVAWNGKPAIVLPLKLADNVSDYNLLLGGRNPPAFSLGWSSIESPVKKGLAAWTAASGQDGHSWSRDFNIPASLRKALESGQPNPDWAQVLSLASKFTAPGAVAADGNDPLSVVADQSSPGPKR